MEDLTFADILAIYGAVVSSILAIRILFQDKRRVKVTCDPGLLISSNLSEPITTLNISITNVGSRPIKIMSASLLLNDGMMMSQAMDESSLMTGQSPLPVRLEDGDSVTHHFGMERIIEELTRMRSNRPHLKIKKIIVRDASGNKYSTKPPRYLRELGLSV